MMLLRASRPVSFRMRVRALLIRLAMLLALVAIAGETLGACTTVGGVAIPGTGPLVTVTMQGGMCPQGACDNSVILDADGKVHSAAKPPNGLGTVDGERMQALIAAINATDFVAMQSRPFTGECPIAFDGQEYIFEFSTTGGVHRLASCEVEIDWGHPLFVALGVAVGEWVPFPLT